jgi:hypothetical protein
MIAKSKAFIPPDKPAIAAIFPSDTPDSLRISWSKFINSQMAVEQLMSQSPLLPALVSSRRR